MKMVFICSLLLSTPVFANDYIGSKAFEVWETITQKPYKEIPSDSISFKNLFDGSVSLIQRSANRTLNDDRDLLPYFTKLAHPNGVCLKGTWEMTVDNPYSGLFKKGSKAIIIGRASVAMNDILLGDQRGFGFAGKIFPTLNGNEVTKTANFFLIDDLGGTKAKHYTDVEMTNEPKVSKTMEIIKNLRYALTLAKTFRNEDENPTKRQVYQLAEATKETNETLKVPKWMSIKAAPSVEKIDAVDFRDEFNMNVLNHHMEFIVSVADTETNHVRNFKPIGRIIFEESQLSEGCDHQLHFHHPKWRPDIE